MQHPSREDAEDAKWIQHIGSSMFIRLRNFDFTNPRNHATWLAGASARPKNTRMRRDALDEAIRLDPEYASAWYDEANNDFDEAERLNPKYGETQYNKGFALKALGRTSEVNAAFAKAKELENAA